MKCTVLSYLVLGLMLIGVGSAAHAQVAVIANKEISSGSINATTLKNLYNLSTSDIDGKKVKLFDLGADSPVKEKFFGVLGKPSAEMRKVWLKAKLTGNGTPPETVSTEEDMVSKVASTPGAVGYVAKDKATGAVKVLLVID